jgi:poly-beta-1,6-N-acetyl-D-glucosamine biosynthesis protein PgaD
MRPLIIERPDLQTTVQRYGYASLTLFGWVLWLYLFVPLLSLGAWVVGGALIYERLLTDLDDPALTEQLIRSLVFIVSFSTAYLLWAFYNYLRWRGPDRRRSAPSVTLDDLSARFPIAPRRIRQLQISSNALVTNSELERLLDPAAEDRSVLLEEGPSHLDDEAA